MASSPLRGLVYAVRLWSLIATGAENIATIAKKKNLWAIESFADQRHTLMRGHDSRYCLPYGIGFGPGRGATPQTEDAQGGSGSGVGMRTSFPWVDAEPPVLHTPVKVSLFG
jgi:hypothetical protein